MLTALFVPVDAGAFEFSESTLTAGVGWVGREWMDGWSKGKVIPLDAMKTYKGSEGVAPLIRDVDTRRRKAVSFTLKRPCLY